LFISESSNPLARRNPTFAIPKALLGQRATYLILLIIKETAKTHPTDHQSIQSSILAVNFSAAFVCVASLGCQSAPSPSLGSCTSNLIVVIRVSPVCAV